jgi:GGDEF domain-containing protein
LFEENAALSGIVVVENDKPCGLVMRHNLDKHLGRKYGYALYYEKPISKIMDKIPLIVDSHTPIELASQVAMNRSKMKLYDSIVVTRNEVLQGIVSVQTLLDTMTRIRLELAKGANPLTGLPGNIAIEQEHSQRAKSDKPFSIVFIDLDYFKSYNDKYGFEKGDEVLLYTANLLKNGLKECCNNDAFLGHVGGDDFIIFTTEEAIDSLCPFFIEYFDNGIKDLYSPEDRKAGGIMAHDRSGQERWFPFISVSLAVLDCTAETGKDMKEISGKVAQLKQYAKSKPGSVYVRDRRKV